MKRISIMTVIFALILCAGCSTYPQSGYSNYNSSPGYYSSSSSLYDYSSSSSTTSSYYDDNYNDYDYYDDDDYYSGHDEDELNDLLANMTYGDFVCLYRDEIIDGAVNVTYQQLARSTDGMEGEYVKFKGEIIQVIDEYIADFDCYTVLMNITYNYDDYFPYYSDTVMISVIKDFMDMRPLVGDIITVWGISSGLTSYESVLGDIRTVPEIVAAKVQFQNSNYGYGY